MVNQFTGKSPFEIVYEMTLKLVVDLANLTSYQGLAWQRSIYLNE
jgi:hypothetical protein